MGDVTTGKALAASARGPRRPYLRTKNVFDGRIDIDDVLTMPMTDAEFERFLVVPGDVLLNEGQSLDLVGRCALYRGEYTKPCAMQNQLLRFRARPRVSAEFAAHLFRYSQQQGVFARIALQTTSIAHLGATRLEGLELAWPEREAEQRAIATALSDVDELIGSLEALIVKKQAIKTAATQVLLTGRMRLPGFGGEWEMMEMSGFVRIRDRKTSPDAVGGDTPCVELEHIGKGNGRLTGHGTAGESSSVKYRYEPHDILFGRLRPYLRKWWYARGRGVCSTEIWPLVVDPSKADSGFVYALVQTDRFLDAAAASYGTHMPRADWNLVAGVEFPLPPLAEQQAIAAVLSDMDDEVATLERQLAKIRAMKQGMMQELLTGRVRLPLPPPEQPERGEARDA